MKIVLIFFALLTGCFREPPVSETKEEMQRRVHEIRFLFENEGCKVWSFYDASSVGDAVYVDCRGSVTFQKSRPAGKTRVWETHQVTTEGTK